MIWWRILVDGILEAISNALRENTTIGGTLQQLDEVLDNAEDFRRLASLGKPEVLVAGTEDFVDGTFCESVTAFKGKVQSYP